MNLRSARKKSALTSKTRKRVVNVRDASSHVARASRRGRVASASRGDERGARVPHLGILFDGRSRRRGERGKGTVRVGARAVSIAEGGGDGGDGGAERKGASRRARKSGRGGLSEVRARAASLRRVGIGIGRRGARKNARRWIFFARWKGIPRAGKGQRAGADLPGRGRGVGCRRGVRTMVSSGTTSFLATSSGAASRRMSRAVSVSASPNAARSPQRRGHVIRSEALLNRRRRARILSAPRDGVRHGNSAAGGPIATDGRFVFGGVSRCAWRDSAPPRVVARVARSRRPATDARAPFSRLSRGRRQKRTITGRRQCALEPNDDDALVPRVLSLSATRADETFATCGFARAFVRNTHP